MAQRAPRTQGWRGSCYFRVGPQRVSLTPPVRLNVLLFASYAEALGASSVGVTLADGATVADLLVAVRQLAGGSGLPPAAVAVNQEYATRTQRLEPGDEVAIIPPVAGG